MTKQAKTKRTDRQAAGQELTDAELDGTVGGTGGGLTEGSGDLLAAGNTAPSAAGGAVAADAATMMVQVAMQRENTLFTSVSNVLKTRHDTTKNTISNIR